MFVSRALLGTLDVTSITSADHAVSVPWLSTVVRTVVNDLKEHSSIQIQQNLDTVLQQLEIMCFDRKFWTETAARCYPR